MDFSSKVSPKKKTRSLSGKKTWSLSGNKGLRAPMNGASNTSARPVDKFVRSPTSAAGKVKSHRDKMSQRTGDILSQIKKGRGK